MSDDKFTPKGEEEIKAEVIEKHGLDVETQEDLINSLTADSLESQKNLGTAIRQKAEWRDKANANTPPETPPEGGEGGEQANAKPTQPNGTGANKSEDRDIEGIVSDVNALTGESEDIVKAMKRIVKADGITYAEAKKDPTVIALKEKVERDTKSANAGLGASGGSNPAKTESKYNKDMTRDEHKKLVMEG